MTNKQQFLSDVLTKVGYKVEDVESGKNGCVAFSVLNGAGEDTVVYSFTDRTKRGVRVNFKIANHITPTETIRNTRSLDERALAAAESLANPNWNNVEVDTYRSFGRQPEGMLKYNSTVLRMQFDNYPWDAR